VSPPIPYLLPMVRHRAPKNPPHAEACRGASDAGQGRKDVVPRAVALARQGGRLDAPADLDTALASGGIDRAVSTRPLRVDENPPSAAATGATS
jgi:hypothetical protein